MPLPVEDLYPHEKTAMNYLKFANIFLALTYRMSHCMVFIISYFVINIRQFQGKQIHQINCLI